MTLAKGDHIGKLKTNLWELVDPKAEGYVEYEVLAFPPSLYDLFPGETTLVILAKKVQ